MFGVRILTFERYHEKNHTVGIIFFRFDISMLMTITLNEEKTFAKFFK